ncbi:hypothetical protein [Mycobacteroides immunogenum]|uniref:Uncharacterized protein n=1 Tax=Mycobacteroides immunogenum TaxID=83262 RepID=A0ABR5LKK6_9MYCO|nr:hypothetical protein [Mycobacteroides immunogenum]KPG26243.1 hypothetical protein AN912_25720 [Mycobacteroides immunogenum]KPG26317.1 hypothetical protein AN913_21405 [Mycobacteroides immunogenum]KPG31811.1 hypothetical protein AN914_25900 [Mycobacteroides immunogenum]KPG39712.1 hypothetical protein AN915_26650 [Mycobacteroides immunogenum]KPG57282.1 hypothetical protein AN918_26430 [Mycobacteroides immunogenum]
MNAVRWPMITLTASMVVWLSLAYRSATSSYLVLLGVLSPAGEQHILGLPGAYPAVGLDAHALCGLLGLLVAIGATASFAGWYADTRTTETSDQP